MKPAPYQFERPRTLDAACALLAEAERSGAHVKIMAGGQSLGPLLNLRLAEPDLVIDISAIRELAVADRAGDDLVLGACVTHADIEDGRVPDVTRGAMQRVAGGIAYRAVRNRGTVGGSLSHADPAADWLSALTALDARLVLQGPDGTRTLPLSDFVVGALETALLPAEMVAAVRVPLLAPSARWGYAKACRKTGEFAHAIGAVLVDPQARTARVVIGALDARPLLLADASGLFGGRITSEFAAQFDPAAADALLAEAGVADPVRRHFHVTVLGRAVREAAQ
ncbi:FAD binding domain-containing protein [Xanthobacter sp. KR7-65]|uniref:FAD binding domain-containing protein n=1 Tax=Xanthobacter sp. KR7-65 TaxID=3156612 RepID=UPI0032B3444D